MKYSVFLCLIVIALGLAFLTSQLMTAEIVTGIASEMEAMQEYGTMVQEDSGQVIGVEPDDASLPTFRDVSSPRGFFQGPFLWVPLILGACWAAGIAAGVWTRGAGSSAS